MDKIQKFQNCCVRFILNLRKYDHISHCYPMLNLLKMSDFRLSQSLTLMHKIFTGAAPIYLTQRIVFLGQNHQHQTRNRNNLNISRFHNNYGQNRFFNFIANKYNSIKTLLDISLTTSIYAFKSRVKKYLLDIQAQQLNSTQQQLVHYIIFYLFFIFVMIHLPCF